jgi:hypothetical protein
MILEVSSINAEQPVAMRVCWRVRPYGMVWVRLYRDFLVIFGRTVAGVRLYRDFSIILCRTATSAPVSRPRSRSSSHTVVTRHITRRCWIGSWDGSMGVWHAWAHWW